MLVLFGSVSLHEFGHALTAKAFGIGTRDITLLPIGGFCRSGKIPTKSLQDLQRASRSKLSHIVIAGLLFICR